MNWADSWLLRNYDLCFGELGGRFEAVCFCMGLRMKTREKEKNENENENENKEILYLWKKGRQVSRK